MEELKVHLCRPEARLPQRQTAGSAGYDLSACIEQPCTIPPGGVALIPTGVAIELPGSYLAGLVFGRSGLGVKHGIVPANGVGVIDSDYRGEISVGLRNQSAQPFTVQPGDRVAQLVLIPVYTPVLRQVEALGETQRGAGGFGSTKL